MDPRHVFGRDSEQKALEWLQTNSNWNLINRNYRCKWGEIDLIFEEKRPSGTIELVFVEVRARAKGSWLSPLASLDGKKRNCMKRVAEYYLSKYKGSAVATRYDLVTWNGEQWCLTENLALY